MNVWFRWLTMLLFCNSISAAVAESFWPTTQEWGEIRTVIQSQLDAFERDDDSAAYSYTAPIVRQRFPTQEDFMKMVREKYSPVYRPREVKFLTPSIIVGQIMQGIEFMSDENQLLVAIFTMERQEDKTWKIASCDLMRSARKLAT